MDILKREEIFSFIEKQKIEGVLLIAADRHRIDLRKVLRPNGYDFFEFVSGRLTNKHVHQLFIRMASFGDIIKVAATVFFVSILVKRTLIET